MKYFLYIFLLVLIYRLFRYFSTPLLRFIGIYKYYSPMLFTMPLSKNLREIHIGTSWDFLKIDTNHQNLVFFYLIEGLLNLAKAAKRGELSPNLKFRGNTHYIKASKLTKYGFESRDLSPFEYFLFLFNYIEICFLKSLVKKKITFHKIVSLKIVYFDIYFLIQNIRTLEKIYIRLRAHLFDQKSQAIHPEISEIHKVA